MGMAEVMVEDTEEEDHIPWGQVLLIIIYSGDGYGGGHGGGYGGGGSGHGSACIGKT
jgi:hypothetical protein